MTGESSGMANWLVVNTQPHKELFAIENLLRQDFSVYCPMVPKTVRHARRVRGVLRPLFPGYLFVKASAGEGRWRAIQSTLGVRRLVLQGEAPACLGGGFVESLRAREIDGAVVLPTEPYRPGQAVRMTGGAFDGLIATILDLDEKGRITVLMELLNQSVRVHTTPHGVRAL